MNKQCARCEKTVYPIEELKCLDKVWHKGCFKCQECSMTLNMRTYKGYGKLPYCEAHIPKVKPTTMAETPELKRIAENTKIQSNVMYHADFEKSKGKFTQVADDPETLRIKANSKIISNVAYHGDLEKKAAMERQRTINDNGEIVTESTDNYHIQLENYAAEMLPPSVPPPAVPSSQSQHTNYASQSTKAVANQSYSNANEPQYSRQPTTATSRQTDYSNNYTNPSVNSSHVYQSQPTQQQYNQNSLPPNVHISSYASSVPQNSIYEDYSKSDTNNDYTTSSNQRTQIPTLQSYGGDSFYDTRGSHQSQQQRIGRIADYDPISDGPRSSPLLPKHGATVVYSSGPPHQVVQSHQNPQHHQNIQQMQPNYQQQQINHQNIHAALQQQNIQHAQSMQQQSLALQQQQQQQQQLQQQQQQLQQQQQQQKMQQSLQQSMQQSIQQSMQNQIHHHMNNGRIGSQMNAPPGSRRIGSVADMDPLNDMYGSSVQQHNQHQQLQQAHQQQQQSHMQHQPPPQSQQGKGGAAGISGRVYMAMYDYEATDTDEVSFREGDLITNVSSIDEGWMTGRVERTGHTGMLPANYVEVAQI